MTKQEKISELEKKYDNLVESLRSNHQCPDRIGIMITKEIVQAQIAALQWEFDDDVGYSAGWNDGYEARKIEEY